MDESSAQVISGERTHHSSNTPYESSEPRGLPVNPRTHAARCTAEECTPDERTGFGSVRYGRKLIGNHLSKRSNLEERPYRVARQKLGDWSGGGMRRGGGQVPAQLRRGSHTPQTRGGTELSTAQQTGHASRVVSPEQGEKTERQAKNEPRDRPTTRVEGRRACAEARRREVVDSAASPASTG